jgi:hypothetical protein
VATTTRNSTAPTWLPRGPGRQVRSPRGAFRPRARRERRFKTKSPLGELFHLDNCVNQNAGAGSNWVMANWKKAWSELC